MREKHSRILSLAVLLTAAMALAQKPAPRILVGPNILVSPGEDYRHHETMLAANPTNPKNLIATSITQSRPDRSGATMTYASTDGGYSWTAHSFPEQMTPDLGFGGGDPEVAFGPKGTAYFLYLGGIPDKPGKRVDKFFFYRSEDGGAHWLPRIVLPRCDHPQMVVDRTSSKFAGNIYVSVLTHVKGKRVIGIFRSEDDGRSFEGPIVAAPLKSGGNSTTPVVLSDGTLIVPYTEFLVKTDKNTGAGTYGADRPLSFVISSDGGRTYSSPSPIVVQNTYAEQAAEHQKSRADPNAYPKLGIGFDWPIFGSFAADSVSTDFRRDRLYAVWADVPPFAKSRVLFAYSSDRGKSWTKPRQLSPDVPANAYQYQPALAVNNRGVLGIQWFDTRDSAKQDSYDLYFAASVDGGQSFLPVKRVTGESSFPSVKSNLRLDFSYGSNSGAFDGKSAALLFHNGYYSHASGGDYMLFEADSDGVFHPFWTDVRTGMRQLWTAQIRVEDRLPPNKPKVQSATANDVTKDVLVLNGPMNFDPATNQATIEIRLKNISDHVLTPPMTVVVSDIGWSGVKRIALPSPLILNSTNAKPGTGAMFDYTQALRDLEVLSPGEVTESMKWRVQLDELASNFRLKLQVTAATPETK